MSMNLYKDIRKSELKENKQMLTDMWNQLTINWCAAYTNLSFF